MITMMESGVELERLAREGSHIKRFLSGWHWDAEKRTVVRHWLSRFLICDSHGRTHAIRCCGKVPYEVCSTRETTKRRRPRMGIQWACLPERYPFSPESSRRLYGNSLVDQLKISRKLGGELGRWEVLNHTTRRDP